MKKILKYATLILLLFVSFSFVLTGCKKDNKDPNTPSSTDRVYGNGGLAVTKGEYLYFLNGYRTYTDVTKDDRNNLSNDKNVVRGAIYKTKLTATGDLNLDADGNIVASSVERVVDQIACFENGGLYIVGSYIYYATPNTQDDKEANLLNSYVNYCRVNLNNPSDKKVLYTSNGAVSDGEWHVYEMNGDIYLVIRNDSKIVCIKNAETKDVVNMLESTNVKFWANEDGHAVANHEQYVYYTRDLKDSDPVSTGNVVARVKIGTDKEEVIARDGNSYTLETLKNNKIYYKDSGSKLRVADPLFRKVIGDKALTQKSYDKMFVIDNQDANSTLNRVLVSESETVNDATIMTLTYFDNGSWTGTQVYSGSSVEILDVDGNYVYMFKDSSIYRLDILSGVETKLNNGDESSLNFSASQKMCFDVDVNYAYILNGYNVEGTTVYYLERVDMTTSAPVSVFVGQFEDGEAPVVEEDEEETTEENK